MKKKTKFNFSFVKHLIRAFILIIAASILLTTVQKAYFTKPEGIRIIQQDEQVASSKYIISESLIKEKLQQKSQLVTLEQDIYKKATDINDSWLGDRETVLCAEGSVKMGLETKNITVLHIDNENGILYLKLPQPILISLEIPYDKVKIEKESGWARMAMNEKEKKTFYKAVEKEIHKEIMNDKELLQQADVFNKDAVMDIMKLIPEIKNVVFE